MEHMIQALTSKLNEEQVKACVLLDNYILTACPGSGKTRTIIYRLAYLSSMFQNSRLKNIAITFTNRAADEMSQRLDKIGIELDSIWTGTIHQFCLEFVIRPFYIYSDRLKKGYRIIDDFVKESYVKLICEEEGVEYKNNYSDVLDREIIKEKYLEKLRSNREIDFEDILWLTIDLLKEHSFIRRLVSNQIRSIQVDEYQDTSLKQYEIIKEIFLSNNEILLSFVGDVNQAIYKNIGGRALNATELNNLFGVGFTELVLKNCYRSTQKIIDYYSNYQINIEGINSLSEYNECESIIYRNTTVNKDNLAEEISKIIHQQLINNIPMNEICVLTPQWWMIYSLGNRLREIMPNVSFDSPELTPVKYDPLNPFYLIVRLLFTEPGRNTKTRKRIAREVLAFFSKDFKVSIPKDITIDDVLREINSTKIDENGITMINSCVKNLMSLLKINNKDKIVYNEFESFIDNIESRIKKHSLLSTYDNFIKCFKERKGIVLSTYHGVKGEEYHTVIATGLLFGFIPNWRQVYDEEVNESEDAKLLVYVGFSRAKQNLFIFSESGRKTQKGHTYRPLDIIVSP